MSPPSHYELLGIEPSATQTEVKSAFRQQALRNHPDQGGNPALFRMIEEAYETLVSPSRRETYDRQFVGPSGDHFYDSDDIADEPTRTWTSEEWEQAGWDRSWQGDYASAFNDREPDESGDGNERNETKPTYVTTARQWPHPSDVMARLPMHWPRWAVFAFFVYVLAAFAYDFSAIPTQSNVLVAQIALVLVFAYVAGPWCLRVAGWVVAIIALWNAAQNDTSAPETAITLVIAFGLWFGGHWLHALKTGAPKSIIADSLFGYLPGPAHPTYRFERRGY